MWVRGELADHLRRPNDGTRVEVVGGEIVGSPGPPFDHKLIVGDIQALFAESRGADPQFPWRCNAANDREPSRLRPVSTKWSGYASTGVAHYLLIDRDPRAPQSALYTEPGPERADIRP
jgi:hypothetical protein